MKIKSTIVTLVIFQFVLTGCGGNHEQQGKGGDIAVSILPLKYLVDVISGGDYSVSVVVPPGASPETYEPTAGQMKSLSRSRVYFQIGLIDFEKGLADGIASNVPNLPVIRLSENMELLEGVCGHDHSGSHAHHHGVDPHIWLSPARLKIMAESIFDQLGKIAPDSMAKYNRNKLSLISGIDSIDRYISRSISGMSSREVLIFHPFMTYYCADYGLEQIAVEEEGKEPSVKHMKTLVEEVNLKGIRSVLYQEQLHQHTVDALSRETGVKPVGVDPLAYDLLENLKRITDLITDKSSHHE